MLSPVLTGMALTNLNTMDRLCPYASTQFKHGSNVVQCLKAEELVNPKETEPSDNETAHKKRVTLSRPSESWLTYAICTIYY